MLLLMMMKTRMMSMMNVDVLNSYRIDKEAEYRADVWCDVKDTDVGEGTIDETDTILVMWLDAADLWCGVDNADDVLLFMMTM